MHILIDGYNLIKQVLQVKHIPEAKRLAFIKQLAERAQRYNHTLVVVFDGGEFGFPNEESIYGVTIIYSGYRQIADDVIKRYLSEYRNRTTLLVSSDRELRDHAALVSVESMGAREYYDQITTEQVIDAQRAQRHDAHARKQTDSQDTDLDALMQEASERIPVKSEEKPVSRESQSRRPSKKERKQQMIKKKL